MINNMSNNIMPYFPFTGEQYKPQVGVKPLDLAQWIEVDENHSRYLSLKDQILREHYDTVIGYEESAGGACLELEDVLKEHLSSQFPDKYAFKDGVLTVLETGKHFGPSRDGREAITNISQFAQEDFCLLSPVSPVKLEAGCVCFPSRWKIADKMGKGSDGIHTAVPKFQETIAKATASFLEKILVEKPMWRLNWTIHDSDELFVPAPHPSRSDLTQENIFDLLYLRVERQALRRLPKTQYVVFSIRTYMAELRSVIQDPDKREILKNSLEGLDLPTAHYKGMKDFFDILKAALA